MKREALRLARDELKSCRMTAEKFNEALNAVLTMSDRLSSWMQRVESSYERVPKSRRAAARFYLISFRASLGDHEGVLRLMPKRFAGPAALVELAFVMDAALSLNRKDVVLSLTRRLPRAIEVAEHPMTRAHLLLGLSEIFARDGNWVAAIATAEVAQTSDLFNQNATLAIVEYHVAGALRALQAGLQFAEEHRQNYDPQTELVLPGNTDAVQHQAANEFRRLQKSLARIVPEKRQGELGLLDTGRTS